MTSQNKSSTLRVERERRFHDEVFSNQRRKFLNRFYDAAGSSYLGYKREVFTNCCGKRVLEYGCGIGSLVFSLAKRGAYVVGIDISTIAIDQALETARKRGVSDCTEFRVMNAEALEFEDNSFDIICGTGIIHHLDLDRALAELARVMKPEGKAVFREPLGYNPVLNFFRRLTPFLRTPDEHPLVHRDFDRMAIWFNDVNVHYYNMLSPLAAFAPGKTFEWTREFFDKIDNLILRYKFFRNWAWHVVICLKL